MKLTAKPLLTSAALLLALAASPAASASQPAPLTPAAASAESNPLARWHDRILPRSPRHARQSSTPTEYGGSYKARGATLRIFTAASYGDGAEVRASRVAWADYFASLPHSSELDRLTVVISPFGEMQTSCGGEADSCYSPGEAIIYLVGETPPDGSDIRQIAAHEYGHHIATNRDNSRAPITTTTRQRSGRRRTESSPQTQLAFRLTLGSTTQPTRRRCSV
ncbi:MAG: hypothetical protein NT122_04330 [Solirubrobacterales bacterium]|nr:hypothetical protein [Solirubrobacterales bacterium]